MAALVTVQQFRTWAGAATQTVPDELVQMCLDEAEAGIVVDVFGPSGAGSIYTIKEDALASPIARGDEMRRAANLLARRNSPEGYAGAGDDGIITVPAGDPGSPAAVRRIRRILRIAAGGSVVVA
jgi:hypothetical protein